MLVFITIAYNHNCRTTFCNIKTLIDYLWVHHKGTMTNNQKLFLFQLFVLQRQNLFNYVCINNFNITSNGHLYFYRRCDPNFRCLMLSVKFADASIYNKQLANNAAIQFISTLEWIFRPWIPFEWCEHKIKFNAPNNNYLFGMACSFNSLKEPKKCLGNILELLWSRSKIISLTNQNLVYLIQTLYMFKGNSTWEFDTLHFNIKSRMV